MTTLQGEEKVKERRERRREGRERRRGKRRVSGVSEHKCVHRL
jgi:hypothetical protein